MVAVKGKVVGNDGVGLTVIAMRSRGVKLIYRYKKTFLVALATKNIFFISINQLYSLDGRKAFYCVSLTMIAPQASGGPGGGSPLVKKNIFYKLFNCLNISP